MLYQGHTERAEVVGGRGMTVGACCVKSTLDPDAPAVEVEQDYCSSCGDALPAVTGARAIAHALDGLQDIADGCTYTPDIVWIKAVLADAVAAAAATTRPPACVYPGCENTRRTRGLCHGHYQGFRAKCRGGKCSESDAEARGLLLPAGTGGATVNGHDAFTDPNARGDAYTPPPANDGPADHRCARCGGDFVQRHVTLEPGTAGGGFVCLDCNGEGGTPCAR